MRIIGMVTGAAALTLGAAFGVLAQETQAPAERAEPTIQPLAVGFSQDGFSGPGAELLRGEIENAQFIGIGEAHGFAAAPALVSAFATEGESHGFDTYAIEVGPWSTGWLRDRLISVGIDGYASELASKPLSVPFLSLREEADVAMRFLEEGKLWGIDQEFIGSSQIHLDWLAKRAGEGADGDELRAWLAADREALSTGNQQAAFMVTAGPDTWARLSEIFAGDAEALELIAALEISQSIYRANMTGRGFDNNTDRVALIREYFLQHYAAAKAERGQAPRVIYKMGAVHVGAATSPMKTFDIGSLLVGIAAAEGRDALRVAYMPIGGEVLGIRPSPDGAFSVSPVTEDENITDVLVVAGVDMTAIEGEGHFIIPLEPVRRSLGNKGINDAGWMERFVLLGFDYLVTTRDAKPATPLADW
ncbi:MAG: hypothetical protein ACX930_03180 [Erythrobacter sp.]